MNSLNMRLALYLTILATAFGHNGFHENESTNELHFNDTGSKSLTETQNHNEEDAFDSFMSGLLDSRLLIVVGILFLAVAFLVSVISGVKYNKKRVLKRKLESELMAGYTPIVDTKA